MPSEPVADQLKAIKDDPTQALAKPAVRLGLIPTSIEEGWRLAQMFAKSELVPKQFRGKPEDVIVAIQLGAEIGFAPMQALQSIAVVNGRPGIWGDGLLALIVSSPVYQDHDEYFEVGGERRDGLTLDDLKVDTTAAVCTFWRRGKSMPVTRRFTMGQARKAGLADKRDTPWQTYPDRMLAMRARGFAARDAFADLLRGIRSGEELRDIPEVADIKPVQRLSTRTTLPTEAEVSAAVLAADAALNPIEIIGTVHSVEPNPDPPLLTADAAPVFVLTMSTGERIGLDNTDVYHELAKFVATDHPLRLTCRAVGDALQLERFTIAD